MAAGALLGLSSCAQSSTQSSSEQPESTPTEDHPEEPKVDLHEFEGLEIDPKAWKYDEDNDVYYQLGVPYCLKPASDAYESLAIFVPGPYLVSDGKKKPTYSIAEGVKVGDYTPQTAPVLMPINSGNLGPQASPLSYSYVGLGNYLSAGCIYVYAGFRGRSSGYDSGNADVFAGGAPWPVVDLKAAVRFLRYNNKALPGDLSRIFTFGFSAGGGVSAVIGASGDSKLYEPYLKEIGAAMHDAEGAELSDAVCGSASWCPVTSFDSADASYEWMMGQYFSEDTRAEGTWTSLLSSDLAYAYASYVNGLDLRDESDQALMLDETSGDIFGDGSYYLHLIACVQDAASDFFENTQFPYTYTPQHVVNASFPGDPNLQSMAAGASDIDAITGDASAQAAGVATQEGGQSVDGTTQVQSVVFDTPEDYVNYLNGDEQWLTYNQTRGTVRITNLGDFVRHLKPAAKSVCAFDAIDRSSVENQLFGVNENGSLHFSRMVRDLLSAEREKYAQGDGWHARYVREWTGDLARRDAQRAPMAARVNMFNPLYFLSGSYEGFGTTKVAPYWRINSGIFQTDTSLCTEVNLSLALGQYEGVEEVSFNPVWGQGHVLAENGGAVEKNLLSWITACCND